VEFDRRVQIRVQEDGGVGFGSGYLIAPRLVLTAGHVIETATGHSPTRVTVCRPDAGTEQYPATVRWCRIDDQVDAALIEVNEGPVPGGDGRCWEPPQSLADTRTRPPQRWGRIIGTRPHPIRVAGFPRMERDPRSGERGDGQITGEIVPGTGSNAGRYELSSLGATIPVGASGQTTGWSGMSGAAVLAESRQSGLLCGVIRQDRRADFGTRLTATPASALLADPEFSALVAQHSGWPPLLEPAEPVHLLEPAARERDLRSPAMVLRADAEAVTFRGREEELAELRMWCEDTVEGFSAWMVTGPGGQGKSRLARQLSDVLRTQGWVTAHLRADLRDGDLGLAELRSLETALPLFLVVDYADGRPGLVRRVIDHLRDCRHRTRLLLLARSAGSWQSNGFGTSQSDEILAGVPTTALAALVPADGPGQARDALFSEALGDLAQLLEGLPGFPGRPAAGWPALAASLGVPWDFGKQGSDHGSVLAVQMTALNTLLQHGTAPVRAAPQEPAEATLLRHEQRYWMRSAQRLGVVDPMLVQRAVAVATMCGAADETEAFAAISVLPELPPAQAPPVAVWLRTLYPPGPDQFWGSLQPDRVGEYLASLAILDFGVSFPLAALLARCAAEQQVRVVTVLARAVAAHDQAGLTVRTAGIREALGNALAETTFDFPVLLELNIALHDGTGGALSDIAVWLAHGTVAVARRSMATGVLPASPLFTSARSMLDIALSQLMASLHTVGRPEEVLVAAREQVAIWQEVDGTDLGDDDRLASALCSLLRDLMGLGLYQEALEHLGQTMAVVERVDVSDLHRPESLAISLDSLAQTLWDMDRLDEAAHLMGRAVAIWEQLDGPRANHELPLGIWRSNLALLLQATGRPDEALRVIEASVEGQRRLARRDPRAYEPMLISSLLNMASILDDLGRTAEACRTMEQTIAIGEHRHRMGLDAGDQAGDIEPRLIGYKLQLGIWQHQLGSWPAFAAELHSALQMWDRLDPLDPDAEWRAGGRLNEAVVILMEAGRWDEALKPAMLALDVWSRLVCRSAAHVRDFLQAHRSLEFVVPRLSPEYGKADPGVMALDHRLSSSVPAARAAVQAAMARQG
jgi:tetratricopeptide (TPR) repeat protein